MAKTYKDHLPAKKTVESTFEDKRTFSYSKGDVSLNFVLSLSKKQQMKDFVDLLEKSLQDVKNVLAQNENR